MLQKIHLFFSQAPTHRSFTFDLRFYTSWSKRFISLKVCVGFSSFDLISFLLKFMFFSSKTMDSLTSKRHNSFQNKNNRKATHTDLLPVARRFGWRLKIQWYLRELVLLRNWPGDELFKLRNYLNFWERQFFSIVNLQIFDIPLLINQFIHLQFKSRLFGLHVFFAFCRK